MGFVELFSVLFSIIPYPLLGIDFGNQVLFLAGVLFCLVYCRRIRTDRIGIAILSVLIVSFVVSLFFTSDIMGSVSGLFHYLNIPVYYLLFRNLPKEKERVTVPVYYSVLAVTALSLLIEGILMDRRIQGNLTYSNSFALILLITVFLSGTIPPKRLIGIGNLLLFTGIFFTGSRTTLFLSILFLLSRFLYTAKDERFFWDLFDFMGAAVLYAAGQSSKIAFLFVFAALAILRIRMWKRNTERIWLRVPFPAKIAVLLTGTAACFAGFVLSGTLMGSRLQRASFHTGELQERLVIFQDAFRHILKYPFGSGINSFEYMQYMEQSAFYDVRFIHNSILQCAYDLGIFPALFLLALLIAGIVSILRSGAADRYYVCFFLSLILIHSMLDFDFSFSSVQAIFVLLIVFFGKSRAREIEVPKPAKHWGGGICTALGLYVLVCSLTFSLSSHYAIQRKYSEALSLMEFNSSITLDNSRAQSAIAGYYRELADLQTESGAAGKYLAMCGDKLETAVLLNPRDVRLTMNLAFVYSRTGEKEKADRCYMEALTSSRFHPELYEAYFEFLGDGKPEKKQWLQEYKRNSIRLLNPKAVFMKDQLRE